MAAAARWKRPRLVPAHAEERNRTVASGMTSVNFFVDGRRVARVHWGEGGVCEWEQHFDDQGKLHGVELYRHESGRIKWKARWMHGLQHGWTRQWAEDGELVSETRFVRGTGVDVWCDRSMVSEVRQMRDGDLDGLEQWWADARRVWLEGHWSRGEEHGIWREWNAASRLRRGFPRYFVHGEQVPRRAYLRAIASDPTLPRPRKGDDCPGRKLTPDAAAAIGAAVARRRRP